MIQVSYRFPSTIDANKQAKIIAIGQTVGSWGAQFTHREQAMLAHTAEVVSVVKNQDNTSTATIGFPRINTEDDIPSLLTMIFGKFSLAGPARIIDIQLPDDYGLTPKLGLSGIQRRTGVTDRPLVMGIFKPALGLSAEDHGELLREVAIAGLDIIKDDEINFDLKTAPTHRRVEVCRNVIDEVRKDYGREIMYAVNLSGRADQMVAKAKSLIDAGANALLLNVFCYGFSVLESLAASPDINIPIFTHPALSGALGGAADGSGEYGIDYAVSLGTLMTFAGADAVLYPAHYGSLPVAAETEFRIRDILRASGSQRPAVLPVPSAGIHPGVVARAMSDYGNDVALNAGSAIFDHPDGPAVGTKAFFEAIAIVQQGRMLDLNSIEPGPLKTALEKWGVS